MGKTIVKSRRFYTFWMKGGKTMLNMLLAVIRTIISELVDLLLGRVKIFSHFSLQALA